MLDNNKTSSDFEVIYPSVTEVSSAVAWEKLSNKPNSLLVDVRTETEWKAVGYPDLSSLGKEVIKLPWRLSQLELNSDFIETLASMVSSVTADIFFICKSGVRSKEAAISASYAGFFSCYNIIDGYEGRACYVNLPEGGYGQELTKGWLATNLPWKRG